MDNAKFRITQRLQMIQNTPFGKNLFSTTLALLNSDNPRTPHLIVTQVKLVIVKDHTIQTNFFTVISKYNLPLRRMLLKLNTDV